MKSMSTEHRKIIEDDFDQLAKIEMAAMEDLIEKTCQAAGMKRPVFAIPNLEILNALHDAREARNALSFARAKLDMAYARRHHYRAGHLLLGITVVNLERRIRMLLKNRRPSKRVPVREFRRDLAKISVRRRRIPMLPKAALGGGFRKVNAENLRLHGQCRRWEAVLHTALRLYKRVVKPN